ncbi:MAG: GGDEF domain-containing protein [Alphaproteobacteria bacterium]
MDHLMLRRQLRRGDSVGRYGGEEFIALLPGTTISDAAMLMDRLRADFATIRHDTDQGPFSATFSCGIASVVEAADIKTAISAADGALYEAKRSGRNRVVTV